VHTDYLTYLIPIAHSVNLNESYDNNQIVLNAS